MKKKIRKVLSVIGILTVTALFTGCAENTPTKTTPIVDITTIVGPSDGLDLKLVGQLFQEGTVKDAEGLEKTLNKDGGINNLDLDSDGNVDYINVSENEADASTNVKSFDLTTGRDSSLTHIATVEVEKGSGKDEYNIHMSGSETMYGSGHHYNSSFHSTGDMLFYAWLFSPRPHYYHTPYYGGHYPTYYGGGRTVVNNTTYINRTTTQRTTASKSFTKAKTSSIKVNSPNKGKTSKSTRTSINSHKTQVKKMTAKNNATKARATKARATKARATKARASRSSSSRSSSSRGSSRSSGGRRSDIHYKTDITDYDNGLETIMQLNGVYYYWLPINNYSGVIGGTVDTSRQVGFIAQDVKKVLPEIVDADEHGLLVNYDLLVPVLVEAIQAQQAQIGELQKRMNITK